MMTTEVTQTQTAEWSDECDRYIYQHGEVLDIVAMTSAQAQAYVEKLTAETNHKHDFNMAAGRAVIRKSPVPLGTTVTYTVK